MDCSSVGSEAVEYYQKTGDPTALYELGGSLLALGATVGVAKGVGSLSGRIAGGISRAWEARELKAGPYFDPKGINEFTLSQKLDLQFKHQTLLSLLEQGDVPMAKGSMSAQLMGEITVASGREVGLIRIGNQRLLRLGGSFSVGMADASRVIAHTHPSGILRFSGELGGLEGDIPSFFQFQPRQRSSVLVAPNGVAVRLPIPR